MSADTPEYYGPGRVQLPPGSFQFHIGRGWDSHYAEHGPPTEPKIHLVWMQFAPHGGCFYAWRPATTIRGRLHEWWKRRQGWTFYDGHGRKR